MTTITLTNTIVDTNGAVRRRVRTVRPTGTTVRVRGTTCPATFLGRDRNVWLAAMRPMPPELAAA